MGRPWPHTAYHRVSDDSVSSMPVQKLSDAIGFAKANILSDDVDRVWVHDYDGKVVFRAVKDDTGYVVIEKGA